MALTGLQSNQIVQMVDVAQQMVDMHERMTKLKSLYYSEGLGDAATDEELAALSEYKHLTNARLVALETAMESVLTALGDYTSGQLGNFLKACKTIK